MFNRVFASKVWYYVKLVIHTISDEEKKMRLYSNRDFPSQLGLSYGEFGLSVKGRTLDWEGESLGRY